MVGFNRRFSSHARAIKDAVSDRANPMIIDYRMNAGFIARDHWVHANEGGGRNIGEACHIYDIFGFLTGARVEHVRASAITPKTPQVGRNDNFAVTIEFSDGSVANLVYTGQGHVDAPKEQMEVFCDGTVLRLDDYRSVSAVGMKVGTRGGADKGHRAELAAFAAAVRAGEGYPIPLWQLVQATEVSFAVEKELQA
jgi:predicted dehydrogenase